MKRWIVAVSLLLLIAASWALLLWSPGREQPAAPLSVSPEVADHPPPAPGAQSAAPKDPVVETPQAPPPPAAAPSAQIDDVDEQEPEPTAQAVAPSPNPTFKLPKLPPPEPQGPVSALKLRFGNESHSDASKPHEQQLTAALQRTGPPPGSVENVECRRSVCRLRWHWKAQHVIPFYQAVGVLRRELDPNLGIDAAKPADADDARTIEIYLDVSARKATQ